MSVSLRLRYCKERVVLGKSRKITDNEKLEQIAAENELALLRARKLVEFLRAIYWKEAQVLRITARSTVKAPDDSPRLEKQL